MTPVCHLDIYTGTLHYSETFMIVVFATNKSCHSTIAFYLSWNDMLQILQTGASFKPRE